MLSFSSFYLFSNEIVKSGTVLFLGKHSYLFEIGDGSIFLGNAFNSSGREQTKKIEPSPLFYFILKTGTFP